MRKILILCMAVALPLVSATGVQLEKFDVHKYFSHPKNVRNRGGGVSSRIIGGVEITPNSYPSLVALHINVGNIVYSCGGSLISNRWVLTSASCLDVKPNYISVILGAHDLLFIDPPAYSLKTTNYVYHSDYNGDTFANDVGLIKLPQDVTFIDEIKPAVLAKGSDRYDGKRGTIVGWGETETVEFPLVPNSVDVSIMTNEACAAAIDKDLIQDMHLCTSGEGIVGICGGDSGGPLFVDGVQVGIVSFGASNCSAGKPSVFTRVNHFYDWIMDTIGNTDATVAPNATVTPDTTGSTKAPDTTVTPDATDAPGGAASLTSLRLGVIVLVALYFAQL